jgi:heme/copper-type cytochrome/quinol oxidase subunit 2
VLAVLTWRSSHALDPYKPLVSDKKPVVIEAISLDWKWLFVYPEEKVAETIVQNSAAKNQSILTLDSMQSTTSADAANGTTYLSVMESNLDVLKQALN